MKKRYLICTTLFFLFYIYILQKQASKCCFLFELGGVYIYIYIYINQTINVFIPTAAVAAGWLHHTNKI